MISLRLKVIIGLITVAVALGIVLGRSFLEETLGLPPRSIGVFAALLLIASVVAILWSAMLHDWARRPRGLDSQKKDNQRS